VEMTDGFSIMLLGADPSDTASKGSAKLFVQFLKALR
jgi:hypothetical protein